nr:flagellar biosynthesis anti-sigma factor FlgM [uncultured Desulfobulbus sp.]
MTVNFFSIPGGTNGPKSVQNTGSSSKSAKAESKDNAIFSSELQSATSAQESNKVQDPERVAKIQALKAQFESGSLENNLDLEKVAGALLNHLVDF